MSTKEGLSLQTWLVVAVAVFASLSFGVFGIRATSVVTQGNLFGTSGGEGASIYGIWKVQRGYPLYERPFTGTFPLSVYNYLFYFSYARILTALGVKGPSLPVGGAALTLLFALLGAFAQWKLMGLVLGRTAPPQTKTLLGALVTTAWLGTGMVSWWALTVRPDVAALALATAGLWAYMAALTRDQRGWILVMTASVLFYLAWAFKQSTICTLAATCLFVLLYRRDLRHAIQLIVPCGSLMALTVWIGGANYWANVFVANSINPLSLSRAAHSAVLAFLPSLFFWAFWLYAIGAAPRPLHQQGYKVQPSLVLLCFVVCVSLGMEFIYLATLGCSRNSLLEAFIACATLSCCMLFRFTVPAADSSGRRAVAVAAISILSMAVLPAAQLLTSNNFGVVRLASGAEYARKRSFIDCLQKAPKPLLTREEMFSLPWVSTGDTYPAFVILWDVYDAARSKGLIKAGVGELIGQRHFGSLLVGEGDGLFKDALQAGYRRPSPPSCPGWQNLRLLSRDEGEKTDSIPSTQW